MRFCRDGDRARAPYRFAMRILAVANWDFEQLPTPWAAQRLDALRRLGFAIDVLGEDCVSDRRGYLRLWRALNKRLATGKYDLVAPLYGSFLGLLCAAQRRVPCALSFAGSDLNGRTEPGRLSLRSLCVPASQLAAFLAAGVSVPNAQMRAALWWPTARRAARVIPDGVDTRRFHPRPLSEARLRRGLPPGGARVAFVALGDATERPYKRLELARAAVARLPGVALDVLSQVPFAEMPFAYAACNALLLTSLDEGSPNCMKEALACGVPVVAVDAGDARELLFGLSGCEIVPADPDALSAALARVLACKSGCPDGPQRIEARYSLDACADAFADFHRETVRGDGRRAPEVVRPIGRITA